MQHQRMVAMLLTHPIYNAALRHYTAAKPHRHTAAPSHPFVIMLAHTRLLCGADALLRCWVCSILSTALCPLPYCTALRSTALHATAVTMQHHMHVAAAPSRHCCDNATPHAGPHNDVWLGYSITLRGTTPCLLHLHTPAATSEPLLCCCSISLLILQHLTLVLY
jgi:hypothetical protein